MAWRRAIGRRRVPTVVVRRSVEIADKAKADAVNASAETKVKTYSCVIWFGSDRSADDAARVSTSAPLTVHQKTPVRVMHSRSLATRDKQVLRLKLELVNPRFGILEMDTSAGMYIKECVARAESRDRASSLEFLAGSSTGTSGARSRRSRRSWAASRTSSSSTCSRCTTTSPRRSL